MALTLPNHVNDDERKSSLESYEYDNADRQSSENTYRKKVKWYKPDWCPSVHSPDWSQDGQLKRVYHNNEDWALTAKNDLNTYGDNKNYTVLDSAHWTCKTQYFSEDLSITFHHKVDGKKTTSHPLLLHKGAGLYYCLECHGTCVGCTGCNGCYDHYVDCPDCVGACTDNCTSGCTSNCTSSCIDAVDGCDVNEVFRCFPPAYENGKWECEESCTEGCTKCDGEVSTCENNTEKICEGCTEGCQGGCADECQTCTNQTVIKPCPPSFSPDKDCGDCNSCTECTSCNGKVSEEKCRNDLTCQDACTAGCTKGTTGAVPACPDCVNSCTNECQNKQNGLQEKCKGMVALGCLASAVTEHCYNNVSCVGGTVSCIMVTVWSCTGNVKFECDNNNTMPDYDDESIECILDHLDGCGASAHGGYYQCQMNVDSCGTVVACRGNCNTGTVSGCNTFYVLGCKTGEVAVDDPIQQTCGTSCDSSCDTACQGCDGGCTNDCVNCTGCDGCTANCTSGCTSNCTTSCTSCDGCTTTCQTSHQGCGSCDGACTSCDGGCTTICAAGCTTQCASATCTGCTTTCAAGCTQSCASGCTKSCADHDPGCTSCVSSCTGTDTCCTSYCTTGCASSCETGCQHICYFNP